MFSAVFVEKITVKLDVKNKKKTHLILLQHLRQKLLATMLPTVFAINVMFFFYGV